MILRLSLRYSFSGYNRHRLRSIRIAVATALSAAVLLTVISIMGYLQDTRMESIRDTRSFEAVIDGDVSAAMSSRFPSASVFPYAESDALVSGRTMTIRFIDSRYDGALDISGDLSGIVVPYSYPADMVSAAMLRRGRSGAMLPQSHLYEVSGRYSSRMGYEFDSVHMFLPLSLYGGDDVVTAVKGIDDEDAEALRRDGYSLVTWKEAEVGLYSALLIEKVLMYLVLSLLFAVILVSLRSSAASFFALKRGERAELMVLGLGRGSIAASFILSFLYVLASGLAAGAMLAVLLRPLALRVIRSFGLYGAELAFPLGTFICLSLLMAAGAAVIGIAEEKAERKADLMEVLRNE